MEKLDEARIRSLLAKGKYKDARKLLDDFVTAEKNNDVAWYLLGILAMKLKNYELAHEYFWKALMLRKRPEYLMFDGLAYLEALDVEDAARRFSECLELRENDAEANFYLAICYLLQGDPRSADAIRRAYLIDKPKTVRMLREFFSEVIEKNPAFNAAIKEEIKKKIG